MDGKNSLSVTGARARPGTLVGEPASGPEGLAEAVRLLGPPAAWLALWGTLNAGGLAPEGLVAPESPVRWLHALRAILPLGVLALWTLHVAARSGPRVRRPSSAESLWLGYGIIGLLAGLAGPSPDRAVYWGLCFLAPFAAAEMYLWGGRRLRKARRLNELTWICTGFALAIMLFAAGGALFTGSGLGVSAYNVVVRVGDVMGMPMTRSSGLSRMAAVLALVTYVGAVEARGWRTVPWAVLALATTAAVAVMGSEGSILAFTGAAFLVTGCLTSLRWLLLLVAAAGLSLVLAPDSLVQAVSGWFPDFGALATLEHKPWSGRPDIWGAVWEGIQRSLALGNGFQADRYLTGLNAQNGFLYALATSGFVGGALYVGGLVLLWRRIWAALRRRASLSPPHRRTLLQVAGVVAFLSLRHVPENTSALFSVDLLLMVPAMVFAGELVRSLEAR